METAKFLAELGGMSEAETAVFLEIHRGKTDSAIMDFLGYTRKSYARIERAVRKKLAIAVMQCIEYRMYA